ncbi:hypothetical protein C0J52_19348 [Blattella germanica]|nr:hypothetical protein C0J52_19348 [Blattella germanica]
MCKEVAVVFHAAATIKFNENLKVAMETNFFGTQEMVNLCKEMPNLSALVYVSTAYSYCPLEEIEEKIYPPPANPEKLREAAIWLTPEESEVIETSPDIEDRMQSVELLFEASSVSSLKKHKSLSMESLKNASIVKLIKKKTTGKCLKRKPQVLGSWPNTYTYSKALAEHVINENSDELPVAIFRPSIVVSTWREPVPGWNDNVNGPTLAILGASLGMIRCGNVGMHKQADFVPVDSVVNALIAAAWETGSSPRNVDMYLRSRKFKHLVAYFATREWRFKDDNVRALLKSLSPADRAIFNFDLSELDWNKYLLNYMLGLRTFVLKEDPSTLPASRKRYRMLYLFHLATCMVVLYLCYLFFRVTGFYVWIMVSCIWDLLFSIS